MLRRACQMAALSALLVPAVAGTATAQAAKAPVVTKVAPKNVFVGQTLTLRGRNFRTGIGKNTVAFKRKGAKVVLVRSDKSTKKMLKVKLPKRLEKSRWSCATAFLRPRASRSACSPRGSAEATRVPPMSPIVGPEKPPAPPRPPAAEPHGDCDGDGQVNSVDGDDDNDLLSDTLEKRAAALISARRTRTATASRTATSTSRRATSTTTATRAIPTAYHAVPGQAAVPEPAFRRTRSIDYDGDSLTLAEEQALWKYTYEVNHSATRTLEPLSYSDGKQHSVHRFETRPQRAGAAGRGRTRGARSSTRWATASRYRVGRCSRHRAYFDLGRIRGGTHIRDVQPRRTASRRATSPTTTTTGNGFLSDNERDEDADGLTNYVEAHGQHDPRVLGGLLHDRDALQPVSTPAHGSTTRTPTATASAMARTTRTTTTCRTSWSCSRSLALRGLDDRTRLRQAVQGDPDLDWARP